MRRLNKKDVKYIVVHCSDTRPGQPCNAGIIHDWHVARGWEMIGYHYVILPDGVVEHGRPLFLQGAHVGTPKNYNNQSIGVCYVGGRNAQGETADTRTAAQKKALLFLLSDLKKEFPHALIVGHRELNKGKACPCFNATAYNRFLEMRTSDQIRIAALEPDYLP